MELEGQVESFRRRGLGVAALSYDPVAVLKDFATRRKITFPLLSDHDSAIIRRFGLLNPEYPEGHIGHGVPYPGTFETDARGVVRAKYFEETYRERRTASSILLLEGSSPGGAEIGTDHFILRTSTSNVEAAPGQRITLALDFEMQETRHVYAPGVQGYRPLTLHLHPHPLAVFHSTQFPEARPYVFKPLSETVPVFEGRFRVLKDLTLATGENMEELLKSPDPTVTITGSLDYQVCSDTVCYPASSVPVGWTLKVRALDRDRPPEELRRKPSRP